MTADGRVRRPLDRVALEVVDRARANGRSCVVGMTALVDAADTVGRAIELARLVGIHGGMPVALVEANLREESRLAAALGVDVEPGLATALARPERAAEAVRPTPDPRLFVMTSGTDKAMANPPGADEIAQVTGALRSGTWATPRTVVDLHAAEVTEIGDRSEVAALPATASEHAQGEAAYPWTAPPPPPPAAPAPTPQEPAVAGPPAPWDGVEVRPFNEGPWPPKPAERRAAGALPNGRPVVTVVLAPPLDDDTDGDVVVRQCDQLVLLVHAGRTSREELAEAVRRCGEDRLVGTVLVTPPPRGRRGR